MKNKDEIATNKIKYSKEQLIERVPCTLSSAIYY